MKYITIKDIARHLSISVSTVSRALGDDKNRLSLKPWGIALKFLFLHHENILFPND